MSRRDRECGVKRRHERRAWAKAQLRQMKQIGDKRLNVYRCRYCGFWHVGHRRSLNGDH